MSDAINRLGLLATFVSLGLPSLSLACTEAPLIEPSVGVTWAEPAVMLRWQPLPGAYAYRLQAEGRRPEAGVEWSVDLIVEGYTYRLELPQTRGLMAVKLRVSTDCDTDADGIRAQPARILIDRR